MSVTQSRKERERAVRENLVLEHAARLLIRDGFQNLNLDELAAAVEYSKGTLYIHFTSKEDLALAVSTQALSHRADMLEQAASQPGTTRERARAMISACGEFMKTHPDFFSVELLLQARSFWDRVSEQRQKRHLVETDRICKVVHQLVSDAHECGDLPGNCSPAQVGLSLMAITMGLHCMVTQPALQTVSPIKDPVADLIVFGERLMDGWGWKPTSSGNHGEACADT